MHFQNSTQLYLADLLVVWEVPTDSFDTSLLAVPRPHIFQFCFQLLTKTFSFAVAALAICNSVESSVKILQSSSKSNLKMHYFTVAYSAYHWSVVAQHLEFNLSDNVRVLYKLSNNNSCSTSNNSYL